MWGFSLVLIQNAICWMYSFFKRQSIPSDRVQNIFILDSLDKLYQTDWNPLMSSEQKVMSNIWSLVNVINKAISCTHMYIN